MKPSKVLLLLTIVLVTITLVSTLLPGSFELFGGKFTIKIPPALDDTYLKYLSRQETKEVKTTLGNTEGAMSDTLPPSPKDTTELAPEEPISSPDTSRFSVEHLSSRTWPIDFPNEDFGTLDLFFRSLNQIDSIKDPVRIMHFGDSQIEGDRISSTLREKLQNRFGGSGPGGFPATKVVPATLTFIHTWSSNWDRYVYRDVVDSVIDHNRLGPYLSMAETWRRKRNENYSGWIRLRKARTAGEKASIVASGTILYGGTSSWQKLQIQDNGKLLFSDSLPPAETFEAFSWKTEPLTASDLSISFAGSEPFDLYGLTFEATHGITLDNIPLRGSSGLEFTKVDEQVLKEGFEALGSRLIILQFGVNIVPVILQDYGWYERSLIVQLSHLRRMLPETAILVIGVSDMSLNESGGYTTYPNIELIRDAQKAAAMKTGCAFWDCYQAMGGKNSMPLWVSANPPLARTDYTHLTNKGSAVMGDLIYRALMEAYDKFLIRRDSIAAPLPSRLLQ